MDHRPERARVVPAVAAPMSRSSPRAFARRTGARSGPRSGGPRKRSLRAGFPQFEATVLDGLRRRTVRSRCSGSAGARSRGSGPRGSSRPRSSGDSAASSGAKALIGPTSSWPATDVLANFVMAENRIAIRWLTWLGFELLVLHRGAGFGGEDFWEFAAFRPGTRERYLARVPPASSAAPIDATRAGRSTEPEAGAGAERGARGRRGETG